MKDDIYIKNLKRNKKIILSSELEEHIVIIKKYSNAEFIITKDNLDKINLDYLKQLNFNNKRIIIDCNIFDVFNDKEITYIEKHKDNIDKIKFRNIYLELGNELVAKCFEKIRIIIDNYDLDTDKIYVFKYLLSANYFLNDLYNLIKAYMIKDDYERYSYIYDIVCDELDRRFKLLNLCDFKSNICVRKRELIGKQDNSILCYGCCYTRGRACPNLKDGKCMVRNIACKFFTCNFLIKQGIQYRPKEFLLIKVFYNTRAIRIAENELFLSKKDMINLMLNN